MAAACPVPGLARGIPGRDAGEWCHTMTWSRGRARWLRLLTLALVLGMAVAGVRHADAQWPNGTEVTNTVHNLSRTSLVNPMSGFIANYQEACVYCHTPHGGLTERPLWNRPLSTAAYRMYEEPLDMLADAQPTGASRLCLSCHDGTLPLDGVLNPPLTRTGSTPPGETLKRCATSCHNGGNPAGGLNWEGVWFDTDLRKTHPVSVIYDPTRDAGFQPIAAVEAAGLRLENGRVQCITCHDPHTQANGKFLRIPNAGGSLCLTCHRTPPSPSTAHFW